MPVGIDSKASAEWFKETHELLAIGALQVQIQSVRSQGYILVDTEQA